MADATLKMILLGEDRGASRAIKGVGDAADKADGRARHLGDSFKHAGKWAALGLAAGAVVAAKALGSMVKNAAEDEAGQRRLAKALQNTTGATKEQVKGVEDWISKQGEVLGVTDDELRPAFQRLVQATGDVGKAQDLAKVAMDASSGSGKSLKVVTDAMAKAQSGNMGALSKLGVKIKDADGKTLSFKDAVKGMADTFKGQASAHADSFSGKMDRLKLIFDETKETIGGKLIPILSKVADWFLKLVKGMQSGEGAGGAFKKVMGAIGDVIRPIGHFIGHELVPFIKELADRFGDAMGGTKGFKDALRDMKPGIDVVKRVLGLLWEGIKWAARVIIPLIVVAFKLWAKYIGIIGKAATWLWNNAFQPAIKFILKAIGWVIEKFADMLDALSKVPGMGWAKKAADKLHEAADQAKHLADNLEKIPKNKKVKVTYTEVHVTVSKSGHTASSGHGTNTASANASGSRNYSGGVTRVGERGPETVYLPRGSRIDSAQTSARRGMGSVDPGYVVVVVQDPSGKVIEEKLTKVRRDRGGQLLAFQR